MNTHAQHYYLFKAGKLVGPLSETRIDAMRKNGELLQYSFMIDDKTQKWSPTELTPSINPFAQNKENLEERVISGAFSWLNRPYLGQVKGMHDFGIELLLDQGSIKGLQMNTPLQLNLVDETNSQWLNTKVIFQNAEENQNGILLRLNWAEGMEVL